jgi:hypothetical protein
MTVGMRINSVEFWRKVEIGNYLKATTENLNRKK